MATAGLNRDDYVTLREATLPENQGGSGYTESHLRHLIYSGTLECYRVEGWHIFIPRKAIEALRQRREEWLNRITFDATKDAVIV